jgi:1-acyl-sn-glycerol-3-phosphate acyltransferase
VSRTRSTPSCPVRRAGSTGWAVCRSACRPATPPARPRAPIHPRSRLHPGLDVRLIPEGRPAHRQFREFGQVPVDRVDTRAAAATIQTGVWTCSRTARPSVSIRKARAHLTGDCTSSTPAWRDCAALRCARIPVGLIGTGQVLIAGDRCWHRSPGAVHFGPALGFSGRVGDERSAPIRREITETVRAAVHRLSGQDYVDRNAASVRAVR